MMMTFDRFEHYSSMAQLIWTGVFVGFHLGNVSETVGMRIGYALLFVVMDVILGLLFTHSRYGDFK